MWHLFIPGQKNRTRTSEVLRKNTHLFIFEHNLLNPLTFYVVRTCDFDKDAKFLHRWDIERLLSRTNFEIVEKKYITFFPHFLRSLRKYEKVLRSFPIGAQYFIAARKGKA